MANTDPEALKAAAEAYKASNVSLADYNPEEQSALDPAFLATRGGENTHPEEPITATADQPPKVAKVTKADSEATLDDRVDTALKAQESSDASTTTAK